MEDAARAFAAQLDEVGALGVAVAGRALGVDGDRAGAGGEAGHDLGQRLGVLGDRRDPVAGREQQLGLGVRGAGHALLVTRQGRFHKE